MDNENMALADEWCCTQVNVTKFSFTWTLNNFSYCREGTGESLESSTFPTGLHGTGTWCLQLYPNGNDGDRAGYVSLFLNLVRNHGRDICAKFTCSILNTDKKVAYSKTIHAARLFTTGESWGWKKFVKRDFLVNTENGLVEDDRLTVLCEVGVTGKYNDTSGENNMNRFIVPACQLPEDLGRLFECEKFGDVVFNVGDRQLHAHKCILTVRCPIFASMFDHDVVEARESSVDIADISYEVFRETLRFIYTGQAPNVDKFPQQLLVAADKYALERLKAMCEGFIGADLSVENAAEVLLFADMHNALQLKPRVVAYICEHAAAVKETPGWKAMCSSRPELALHLAVELLAHGKPVMVPSSKRKRSK